MQKTVRGISIIELLVAVTIIMILSASIIVYVNPDERRKIARDNKRFADISTLDRAINEYLLDNGSYPDAENVLRRSNVFTGESISLDNSQAGWINADLSKYTSRLPVDPINDDVFNYSYIHNATSYELNAVVEILFEYAQDDGGNDPNSYEIGNDLTLISP